MVKGEGNRVSAWYRCAACVNRKWLAVIVAAIPPGGGCAAAEAGIRLGAIDCVEGGGGILIIELCLDPRGRAAYRSNADLIDDA